MLGGREVVGNFWFQGAYSPWRLLAGNEGLDPFSSLYETLQNSVFSIFAFHLFIPR